MHAVYYYEICLKVQLDFVNFRAKTQKQRPCPTDSDTPTLIFVKKKILMSILKEKSLPENFIFNLLMEEPQTTRQTIHFLQHLSMLRIKLLYIRTSVV